MKYQNNVKGTVKVSVCQGDSPIDIKTGRYVNGAVPLTAASTQNIQYPNGSFSITNWEGYPSGAIKPNGPFVLLEGAEYNAARTSANQMNSIIRNNNPNLVSGFELHEIQPVKFGGSPTDISNKMLLTPVEHDSYTIFWNKLQKNITNGIK